MGLRRWLRQRSEERAAERTRTMCPSCSGTGGYTYESPNMVWDGQGVNQYGTNSQRVRCQACGGSGRRY